MHELLFLHYINVVHEYIKLEKSKVFENETETERSKTIASRKSIIIFIIRIIEIEYGNSLYQYAYLCISNLDTKNQRKKVKLVFVFLLPETYQIGRGM